MKDKIESIGATLLVLLLMLGCASTTFDKQITIGQLGLTVNQEMQKAVGFRNQGKIDDLHWQWINERYGNFRYQLDVESKAASMNFEAQASSNLKVMAGKVLDEIKPHLK
jgi:hypothetical protein